MVKSTFVHESGFCVHLKWVGSKTEVGALTHHIPWQPTTNPWSIEKVAQVLEKCREVPGQGCEQDKAGPYVLFSPVLYCSLLYCSPWILKWQEFQESFQKHPWWGASFSAHLCFLASFKISFTSPPSSRFGSDFILFATALDSTFFSPCSGSVFKRRGEQLIVPLLDHLPISKPECIWLITPISCDISPKGQETLQVIGNTTVEADLYIIKGHN